nr:hypothetical protein [Tanacetum cinerariifolium]
DNVSSSESTLTFAELFETNELKAQIQEKDTVILKLKEKIKSSSAADKEREVESKVEDIETQNLELDHRVIKLTAKNNHLKQTYKQLFDSIKSSHVQSKEQCDDLINKVNLKSVEVADLNASLQEKVLVITALKEQLKGKAVLPKAVSLNPIDPALLQSVEVADFNASLQEKVLVITAPKEQVKGKAVLPKALSLNPIDHALLQLNVNADLKCATCNGCLFSDNHDSCVLAYINSVNARKKSKSENKPVTRKVWKSTSKVFKTFGYIWKPTGRTFTLVGNVYPLTKIATATIVPPREPIPIVKSTDKPVVTL